MGRFDKRVAIVTGAGTGIGKASALALVALWLGFATGWEFNDAGQRDATVLDLGLAAGAAYWRRAAMCRG